MTIYSCHPTNINLYDVRHGVDLGIGECFSYSHDNKRRDTQVSAEYQDDCTIVHINNNGISIKWLYVVPPEFREYLSFYSVKGVDSVVVFKLLCFEVVFDGPEELAVMWRLML